MLMYYLGVNSFQQSVCGKLFLKDDLDMEFGTFKDQIPSRKFIKNVYLIYGSGDYDLRNKIMQSIPGTILKCDHTFKVAKVPNQRGTRLFEALLTVMNEKNQILGYWFTQTKSLEEVRLQFQQVRWLIFIFHL